MLRREPRADRRRIIRAPTPCPPSTPSNVAMLALLLTSLASLGALATGCKFTLSQNPVTDLIARDWEPPEPVDEEIFSELDEHVFVDEDAVGSAGSGKPKKKKKKKPGALDELGLGLDGDEAESRLRLDPAKLGDELARNKFFGGYEEGFSFIDPLHPSEDVGAVETVPDDPVYYGLFVPLPVFSTNPNAGNEVGVLPVVVFRERKRITNIFAPSYLYSELIGHEFKFRMRQFPSRTSLVHVDASWSTEGELDEQILVEELDIADGRLFARAEAHYAQELAPRFFGFGNDTDDDDESTYTNRESGGFLQIGGYLPWDFEASYTAEVRNVAIRTGQIDDLPDIRDLHGDTSGLEDRNVEFSHRIDLVYDSRRDRKGEKNRKVPVSGAFVDVWYKVADEVFQSDFFYNQWGVDARIWLPLFDNRLVTVARVGAVVTEGRDIPFWARPSLGGKESLRGFGEGRFVEDDAIFFSLEERVTLFEATLMDTLTMYEVAAFIDGGRVFGEDDDFTLSGTKFAVGGAVRLIVPNSDLVTSIDVGFGNEGPAIFVTLDYPY